MQPWLYSQRLVELIRRVAARGGEEAGADRRGAVLEQLDFLFTLVRRPRSARRMIEEVPPSSPAGRLVRELKEAGVDAPWSWFTVALRGEVMLAVGSAYKLIGEFDRAAEVLEELTRRTHRTGDRRLRAAVYLRLGDLASRRSHWAEALRHYRRSRALYESLGDALRAADASMLIGTVYSLTGRYPLARQHYEQALREARRAKNHDLLARVRNNLGIVASVRGDRSQAMLHWRAALHHAELAGAILNAAEIHHNLGVVLTEAEEWDEAERCFDRSVELARRVENRELEASAHLNRARLHALTGDAVRAAPYWERAGRVFEELGHGLGLVEADRVAGLIDIARGRYEDAESRFQAGIARARSLGARLEEAELRWELGRLAARWGKVKAARSHWEIARTLAVRLRAGALVTQVDRDLGRLEA